VDRPDGRPASRPPAGRRVPVLDGDPGTWAGGHSRERFAGGPSRPAGQTVQSGTTTATDTALANGTTHTYRVRTHRGTWVSLAQTTTLTPSC
jgi:hypothetical protein